MLQPSHWMFPSPPSAGESVALKTRLGTSCFVALPGLLRLRRTAKALHQRISPSLQELQAAAGALAHADAEPTGKLRITTAPGFGQSHQFVRCIKDYGLKYPKTTIELELTTRLVNMVEEGFDVGLRMHTGELSASPTLMSRRLLRFGRAMYASPDYIEEMGVPATPEDLTRHRIAAHSIVDVRGVQWNQNGKPLGKRKMLPPPRWLVNDLTALERFALSGAGLALLSTIEGESLAARGDLVRVLPEYEEQGATTSLIWPASRHRGSAP